MAESGTYVYPIALRAFPPPCLGLLGHVNNKPANQQANKPTNQQTNKPTDEQTNKPTHKAITKLTTCQPQISPHVLKDHERILPKSYQKMITQKN